MKTYNDCIPCLVRQALGAARFISNDEGVHQKVLKKTLAALAVMDMNQAPPMMARHIQNTITEVTGNKDPYKKIKKKFNKFSLGILEDLRAMVESSKDPLKTAVRLSIAGNIIDFGALSTLDKEIIFATIDHAMANEVKGNMEGLIKEITAAGRILWIADNAGEIVFDRLVLEKIDRDKVTFVVRGGAALNDATLEDARDAGISDKAKCPVVAGSAGVNLNDMVIRNY